jgi:hypothetical protein
MSSLQGYGSDDDYDVTDAFNLAAVPAPKKARLEPEDSSTNVGKPSAPHVLAEVRSRLTFGKIL